MGMFNWLHYLNCEAIDCSLGCFHPFVRGATYVQTVMQYVTCDRLPRAVPVVQSPVYVIVGRFCVCVYIRHQQHTHVEAYFYIWLCWPYRCKWYHVVVY